MKHHDLRNRALLEKLTKQYSKGEVEEGLWDTLKGAGKKVMDFGKEKDPDPAGDPRYRTLSQMGLMDSPVSPQEKEEKEEEVKNKLEDQGERLKWFANQTLILLSDAGIKEDEPVHKDIVRAMKTAQDALKSAEKDVNIPDPVIVGGETITGDGTQGS